MLWYSLSGAWFGLRLVHLQDRALFPYILFPKPKALNPTSQQPPQAAVRDAIAADELRAGGWQRVFKWLGVLGLRLRVCGLG